MSGAPSIGMPGGGGSEPPDSHARWTGATSPHLERGLAGDTLPGTFWRHPPRTFYTRLEIPRLEQSALRRHIKRPLKLPPTATCRPPVGGSPGLSDTPLKTTTLSTPRRGRPRTFRCTSQDGHLDMMWPPQLKSRRSTSMPRFGTTSNAHHKET